VWAAVANLRAEVRIERRLTEPGLLRWITFPVSRKILFIAATYTQRLWAAETPAREEVGVRRAERTTPNR
jgi:hypothetical protein